jgi:hypothetical protein
MNAKFETLQPNEDVHTDEMIDVLRRKMERTYKVGATLRDAHPKHLGLLKATFTVEPGLPAELGVGLFSQPGTYDAWVGASNSFAKVRSDAIKDSRGFAIKLLNVPGAKIPESDEPGSQDFILVSSPSVSLGTVKLFHDAIYYSLEWYA